MFTVDPQTSEFAIRTSPALSDRTKWKDDGTETRSCGFSEPEKSSWSTEAIRSSCNADTTNKHKKPEYYLGENVLWCNHPSTRWLRPQSLSHSLLSCSTTVGVQVGSIFVMEAAAGNLSHRIGPIIWLERHVQNGQKEEMAGLRLEHSVWSMDMAGLERAQHGSTESGIPCKLQSGYM
jgi:hypothetical protein